MHFRHFNTKQNRAKKKKEQGKRAEKRAGSDTFERYNIFNLCDTAGGMGGRVL